MTEDVNNPTADDSVEHAEDKNEPIAETKSKVPEGEIAEAELVEEPSQGEHDDTSDTDDSDESSVESEEDTQEDADESDEEIDDHEDESTKDAHTDSDDDSSLHASDRAKTRIEFQAEIREQIENCKFEIVAALQENIHTELTEVMEKQIRKVERRRRAGFWLRDIIILILSVAVGFCLYFLYDAQYFDFILPRRDSNDSGESSITANSQDEPEVVKDKDWYLAEYKDLFQSLQTGLDANRISAYYLYSGDYKASEIPSEYLLAMAYSKLSLSRSTSNIQNNTADVIVNDTVILATDLRKAFIDLIGTDEGFEKQNFKYDCTEFRYDRTIDSFVATTVSSCTNSPAAGRSILEEVDNVYEEGNVLYFLTTATVYDRADGSFYGFNNLFKPLVKNVEEGDLSRHSSLLNHYQYQFKKKNDKYYFSSIVKLD